MITVIIPTLWALPQKFCDQLEKICDSSYVSEIIIVNNNVEETPSDSRLKNKKIMMLNQDNNIYVNPAWNLGVSLSTNNTICLLNDDLQFDTSVFSLCDENNIDGLLGINADKSEGPLRVEYISENEIPFGFCCMMFLNKSDYVSIPDDLKVLFGDTFLIKRIGAKKRLGMICGISNDKCFSQSITNQTFKTKFHVDSAVQKDYENYNRSGI